MRDIVLDLRTPLKEAVAVAPAKAGWWQWVAAAFALAFLAAGFGWYNLATRPAPLRPLMRLDLEVPPATPLSRIVAANGIGGHPLAISPDGTRLAVSLRGADGKVRLHTRLLQESQFVPLAGTENAQGPFFSPDGDWIGFFADAKLKKVAVLGGATVTLCDARYSVGGSWGDDGNIIAALNASAGLSRVPSAGGTPVPITKLNDSERTHRWPQVLPGSQTVLFTAAARLSVSHDDSNIEVLSLRTGERKTLHRGGYFGRYLADGASANGLGHLIYLHQSTVFAVPFDSVKLTLAGAPVPFLEGVSSTTSAGGDIAFARNGTLVYLAGKANNLSRPISWVDSAGQMPQPLYSPPGLHSGLSISPDGKRMAFALDNGKGQDIWVKDFDRDMPSRLSFLPEANTDPVWTPDGKIIVFRSENPAAPGLYAIRSDGSGEAKRLGERIARPFSFTPDGKRLAILQIGNSGSSDIFTVPVEADSGPAGAGLRLGKPELFLGTPFQESCPAFSPDGRWLAYQSDESGAHEVYVRPFPGPGGRWQVSAGGGLKPVWSRDGRELLFLASDGRVMVTGYTAKGDSFAAGQLRVWTKARIPNRSGSRNYDIAPDGKRLAAIVDDDANSDKLPTHLTFLLNVFDELRRKAPVN